MRLLLIMTVLFLSAGTVVSSDNSDTTFYPQPVLLTSVGQAADVLIIKGLALRCGLKLEYKPAATADSLGDCKTLLLVAGGSSKGLGAAKIDPEVELKRVKGLTKAAHKAGIPILVYHIGGDARRGALSDPFNELAAEEGMEIVVVSSGDEDGFFKKVAEKNKAKYITIDKSIEVMDVLKRQFRI